MAEFSYDKFHDYRTSKLPNKYPLDPQASLYWENVDISMHANFMLMTQSYTIAVYCEFYAISVHTWPKTNAH